MITVSRRRFLSVLATATGGIALPLVTACAAPAPPTPTAAPPTPTSQVTPAEKPVSPMPTPTAAPIPAPVVTPTPGAEGPVTLRAALVGDDKFWEPQFRLLKQFAPRIGVQRIDVPVPGAFSWGAYFDKVAVLVAAGVSIDIVRIPIEGAKLVVALGIVRSLDDYLRSNPMQEVFNDIDPRLVKVFQIRGQTWAIPWDFNNMLIHYNTAHFREAGIEPPKAGWTYDDFLQIAQKLTRRSGGQVERFGFALPNAYHFQTIPWVFNRGASHLSDDWNRSTINDEKFLSAIDFLRTLVWQHRVATVDSDPIRLFYTGKASMVGAGRWPLVTYRNNGFSTYDIAPWPVGGAAFTEFGVGAQWIMKMSRYPDAAFEVIRFFASKESQEEYHTRGGAIAARKSVALSAVTPFAPPSDKLFYQVFDIATPKPVPSPPDFNRIEDVLRRAYQETVVTNARPTAEVWFKAHEEVTKIISERPKEWEGL